MRAPRCLGSRDGEHGLGRSLKQDVVDCGLVLVGDIGDLSRQREHDVEVGHRQELGLAFGQPLALSPIRDTLIEGFSHFVTSMTAPIASGWSGCRVGFAPTGKRRLVTAHTRNGHGAISF
jgi:hypothetical protein